MEDSSALWFRYAGLCLNSVWRSEYHCVRSQRVTSTCSSLTRGSSRSCASRAPGYSSTTQATLRALSGCAQHSVTMSQALCDSWVTNGQCIDFDLTCTSSITQISGSSMTQSVTLYLPHGQWTFRWTGRQCASSAVRKTGNAARSTRAANLSATSARFPCATPAMIRCVRAIFLQCRSPTTTGPATWIGAPGVSQCRVGMWDMVCTE